MIFELVDPLNEPRWNDWIQDFEAATFFHTAEWASVLAETYRYPVHYGVLRDANRVVALLPMMEVNSFLTGRRGVSLPFSDECAPLLSEGVSPESIVEPMREFGLRRGWDYLELRGEAGSVNGAVQSDEFLVHRLELGAGEERQFGKIKAAHQRNVRQARGNSIEIHHLRSREAIEAYYSLHCLTRKRQGLPPQPIRFFRILQERVLAKGHGFVLLARSGGQWIAGGVFFRFGSKAIFKFGASDFHFQHLRANNLVMWKAIHHLSDTGATELSFGRTCRENQGLLQFKRGWGAEETILRYYRVGIRKKARPIKPEVRGAATRTAAVIMRHLPISVLRLLGGLSYRHVG